MTASGSGAARIRPFRLDDLPRVAALYCEVFNAPPWNDQWTEAVASRRLADVLATPGALGLLLWDGDSLSAGLLGHREHWFSGTGFFIKEMFVRPDHQRSGRGSALMRHLKETLMDEGVRHIFLTTERDGIAAEFYTKHGFTASTRMVLMTCRIDPA